MAGKRLLRVTKGQTKFEDAITDCSDLLVGSQSRKKNAVNRNAENFVGDMLTFLQYCVFG